MLTVTHGVPRMERNRGHVGEVTGVDALSGEEGVLTSIYAMGVRVRSMCSGCQVAVISALICRLVRPSVRQSAAWRCGRGSSEGFRSRTVRFCPLCPSTHFLHHSDLRQLAGRLESIPRGSPLPLVFSYFRAQWASSKKV